MNKGRNLEDASFLECSQEEMQIINKNNLLKMSNIKVPVMNIY